MKYLLDINALIAWEHRSSPHHAIFHAWAKKRTPTDWWTCALTELGFIRVSMQVFGYDLPQATAALGALKKSVGGFVATAPSPCLPAWASMAARTSDGYLVQIAQENGMKLATFDARIKDPAVELIGL